ncbi:MAG: T9SS type A sorting domain-containing protein [Bacteroidales bacterium]|nr:T9SS type A sorting domain-containing protein [Bacteroidales bacterium]
MIKYKSVPQKVFILIAFLIVSQTIKGDSLKVLFLGNSHTFYNDLPQLIYELALSNGDIIMFESNTPGGCTLGHPQNGHLFNSVSLALIDSLDWDYVILQEHSLFAVIDYYRDTYMYPGARSLDSLIKLNNECTETIIQLIWGKKNGGEYCINSHCTIDFEDFAHMQDSLTTEYLRLADTLSCTVAPTGVAWKHSIQNGDPIELFNPDESHPSLAGSYLAACIYYSVLFQKSPVGFSFSGGLNSEDAYYFQQIADDIVFSNPELWNINGSKPIAGFETMQVENTVICTDTSVNADFYHWDFGDGTTDTVQDPSHTYNASGTYIITQEVSTFCNADVTSDTIVINLTNISKQIDADQSIYVVPGYGPGEFSITSGSSKMYQVDIYGLEGRLERSENLKGKREHLLKMNFLLPGFYILVVHTGDGTKSFKILQR